MATIPGSQRLLNLTGSTVATTATIQAGTLLIGSGVTAGGKVTNVTAGTANTDAVNVLQLNNATTGVLVYQGTWNASTNSPSLASGTGTPGYYYIVSTDGSTNLDGITDWKVGDWAVFSDQATDAWQKIDNSQVGNVTGSGVNNRLAIWNGTSAIDSDSRFFTSGTRLIGEQLAAGDGTDGYFYSDSAGRTAFTGGDFYIQSGVTNSYNYATNQYIGNSSGDNIYFRGNALSGNNWSIGTGGNATFAGDVTVSGGDITLGGTGRIQGIDTVTATTDAANKLYVDNAVAGVPIGNYVTLATAQTITGAKTIDTLKIGSANKIQFANNDFIRYEDATGVGRFHFDSDGGTNNSSVQAATFVGALSGNAATATIATLASKVSINSDFSGTHPMLVEVESSGMIYNNPSVTYNGTSNTLTSPYLTVSSGGITLSGTGRIQGIDTVSASTDAANKAYVDAHGAGVYLPLAGGNMTGDIQMSANSVKFDQSGTRSWDISAGSGNLNITSGDSGGNVFLSPGLIVEDATTVGGNLTVAGNQYFNGEFIEGDGKEMFRYTDAWLRINEDNDFSSGIYCGTGALRTDGVFQVGSSGTKFLVTTAGAVTAESTLTLDNGQIVLGGTGRIQGVDTVSASTDAANKAYVDAHPAGTVTGTGVTSKIAVWSSSTSIIDGPVSFSGNNATFAGNIAVQGGGDSYFTGDVGIGITSPLHRLSIESAGATLLKIRNTTNGGGAAIEFNDNGSSASTQNGKITYYHSDSVSQGGGSSYWLTGENDQALVLANNGRVVVQRTGSSTEVGYGFYDDVNTGMYRIAADNLGFATAGVNRLNITNASATFSGDLTVNGGDIILGGTGRIQGVDTVSSNTDAANKAYVDNYVDNNAAPYVTFTRTGINSSTYTMIATVNGDRLASIIKMTMTGTSNSVVFACTFDIIVNHSTDIHVKSMSGDYTDVTLRITSNNNEDYSIEAKHNGGSTTTAEVCIFPLAGEAITPTTTDPGYTGAEYEHTATEGWRFGGEDGNVESSNVVIDGKVGIGTTSPGEKLEVKGNLFLSNDNSKIAINQNLAGTPSYGYADGNNGPGQIVVAGYASSSQFPGIMTLMNRDSSISANQDLGVIQFVGKDDATNGYASSQIIGTSNTSAGTGNSGGGILRFLTSNGSTLSEKMRIDSNGRLGINTTSLTAKLNVVSPLSSNGIGVDFQTSGGSGYGMNNLVVEVPGYGTGIKIQSPTTSGVDNGAIAFFQVNTKVGSIQINTSSTSYNTTSDYRLKENKEDISDAIERVKQLKPVKFNWIKEPNGSKVDGFYAHELADIVPEAVTGEKDALDHDGNPSHQAIDQSKIVPLLTAALQQAIDKIEALELKINKLNK